jgi:hypothetical protein
VRGGAGVNAVTLLKYVIHIFKDAINSLLTGNIDNLKNVNAELVSVQWQSVHLGSTEDVSESLLSPCSRRGDYQTAPTDTVQVPGQVDLY